MVKVSVRAARATVVTILIFSSCTLFFAPEAPVGRESDPERELFVVHSLAETISSVALSDDGTFSAVTPDVQILGAIPNHIIRADELLVVTLSGENALLLVDASTMEIAGRVTGETGRNPMESVWFGTIVPGSTLVATSNLLTGTVTVSDLAGAVAPVEFAVGTAPQAVLVLPGQNGAPVPDEVRLIVANTGFSVSNPADHPFGEATVTELVLTIGAAGDPVTLVSSRTISLGDDSTNPVRFVDFPAENEVVVVCSGVNYGSDGTGSDDGSVVILNRDTLSVEARIDVGRSPGAAVLSSPAIGGHTLYLGGPEGIRAIYRTDGSSGSWNSVVIEIFETDGDDGGFPLISDIALLPGSMGSTECTLYAADFRNNAILRFVVRADGAVDYADRVSVSQGPVALLVDDE